MSHQPLSILISGAGIAGSSFALALARHPAFKLKPVVTLIERAPVPRTTGQAIDIRGPAVQVIRKLGIEQKIKERHTSEVGIAFVDARGKIIARHDATGDSSNQSATSEYEILRGELADLLLDEVEATRATTGAEVNVVYGESIESLQEEEDGVAVRFVHGKVENAKWDVVVACDGYRSSTRSKIFDQETTPKDPILPMGMYIAYYTIPRVAEDDDLWRWFTTSGGLAMHLRPHRNKTTMGVYLSITGPSKAVIPELDEVVAQGTDAQKALLRQRFQDIGWQSKRFLDELDGSEDLYMQSIAMVINPKWTKGRCAIAGDSAFAIMGMGTSYAMIGGYTLAGELSKIESNSAADVAAALQNYESIVRPLVAAREKPPPFFPQTFNPQTQMGVTALHTMLRVAFGLRIPQIAQWALSGESKETWKLPDYGWEEPQADAETK